MVANEAVVAYDALSTDPNNKLAVAAYDAEVTLPNSVCAVDAKLEVVANDEEMTFDAQLLVPKRLPVNPLPIT